MFDHGHIIHIWPWSIMAGSGISPINNNKKNISSNCPCLTMVNHGHISSIWPWSIMAGSRGCARGEHGVIGAHLQKWPPTLDFWQLLGVIDDPLFFFELCWIPEQVMTLTVCILTPIFKTQCNPWLGVLFLSLLRICKCHCCLEAQVCNLKSYILVGNIFCGVSLPKVISVCKWNSSWGWGWQGITCIKPINIDFCPGTFAISRYVWFCVLYLTVTWPPPWYFFPPTVIRSLLESWSKWFLVH